LTADTKFSTLGLGCVTFGREIDHAASVKIMDHAFANGITFFDTAPVYGSGNSENIIGTWLSKNKHAISKVTVATKISPPFVPKVIRKSVDESLKRLKIDKIDVLYLHRWDPSVEALPVLEVLDELRRNDKIVTHGVSNFTYEQARTVFQMQTDKQLSPFRYIQNNNNFAIRDINEKIRNFCNTHNISIATYSPLGAGFLTGKHQNIVQKGSRFDVISEHQEVYFNEAAYKRLEQLQSVARKTGFSVVQLALAWAFRQPGISSVLVGARNTSHLDQAFAALKLTNANIFFELE
jgi:aryl-alcohol dehydrogenase-like predicted oxidoreductase